MTNAPPVVVLWRVRRALLWLLVLGLLFVPALPEPALRTGAFVQDVGPTSAVVAIVTASARALRLELKAQGAAPLALTSPARRRHAFALHDLVPSRRYEYVLEESDGARVDAGSFTTYPAGDAEPFTFCVVGDSGKVPAWAWMQDMPAVWPLARFDLLPTSDEVTRIGAAMARETPRFWLHVGDVVYPYGEARHYRCAFFRPFAEMLRGAPCYATLGNHDLGNNDPDRADQGRQLLRNLTLPRNTVTGDERMYAFACGPLRVICVDWNQGDERRPIVVNDEHPSMAFLRQELAGASEPWIVVFAHYPIWSASRQRDRQDLLRKPLELLNSQRVDLLFCGHDHVYQRFGGPDRPGVTEIVSGGGGKSLYELRPDPRLACSEPAYHFCSVHVDGARLTVRARGLDGGVIDEIAFDLRTRLGALDPTGPRLRRARELCR